MKDINLMLEEDKQEAPQTAAVKKGNGSSVKVLLWVLVSIFIVGITVITPTIIVRVLQAQTDVLKDELTAKRYQDVIKLRNEIRSIDSTISTKQQIIKTIDKENPSVSDIINGISKAAPKGLYLNGLILKDQKLNIKGATLDSTLQGAEFIANLDRLDLFTRQDATESVKIKNTTKGCSIELDLNLAGKGAN